MTVRALLSALLSLLVTSPVWSASVVTCDSKGTLGDRIASNLKTNDANGNSYVTGPEIFDDLVKNYDIDQDGCVDKKEWMDRWTNFYKFSPEVSQSMWGGDDSKQCPLRIDDYKTNPVSIPTDVLRNTIMGKVVSICNSSPTLSLTNCDCKQLTSTCAQDAKLMTTQACTTFMLCQGAGLLADRLRKNLNANDKNGDKIVTSAEIVEDLRKHYDPNMDGCTDLKKWNNRWTTFYKFSQGYGEQRFKDLPANASAPCPVDISFYENAQVKIPLNDFVGSNLQSLIDFCKSDPKLMTTNCDCAQLPGVCKNDSYFKTISACILYSASVS